MGLDFNLPTTKLNFFKYFSTFERLYATLSQTDIIDSLPNAMDKFKHKLRTIANKYYYNSKSYKNSCPIFNKDHFNALRNLSRNKNIYITKPDKGQGVVLLNRNSYIQKVLDIIDDIANFIKIDTDEKVLCIKLEDKVNNQLSKLKSEGCITDDFYCSSYASGTRIGSLYGLLKVHKENIPVRPILSASGTHNFSLRKSMLPLISHLSKSEYSLANSHDFINAINEIPNADEYYMCSFDIVSLYTNVPVEEAINVILNSIYSNDVSSHKGLSRTQLEKLLALVLNDSYFKFNDCIYKQTSGLSMGSSISPVIANIFLNNFESTVLANCPLNFKPSFYRRYMDDTFLLFRNEQQAKMFLDYINSQHNKLQFTYEGESKNCLPFLDVMVTRTNNSFVTSVFRKETFTGLGTIFFSNLTFKYKTCSIYTLIHRAYRTCSNYSLFHTEVVFLRSFFTENFYPENIFNGVLKKFLNQRFAVKISHSTVPRHKIFINLPYIGFQTTKMQGDIRSLLSSFFPQIQPNFYYNNNFKIGSFFSKYRSPDLLLRSSVIYQYECHCCQQCYIGSTQLQLFRRIAQHEGVSFRTFRHLSKPDFSSIRLHCETQNHPFNRKSFTVIDSCNSKTDLKLLESLHISQKHPSLNTSKIATPLNIIT